MLTEADTCRKHVVPLLQSAGWETEPHSIAEQRTITDGRIVPVGKGFVRKLPKRVDYLLRYRRDFSLAIVEAKAAYKKAADGLQQAKDYAEMLGLKFAYATNGEEIIEFDYFTGLEKVVSVYPTPDELWQRYRQGEDIADDQTAERLLTPFNHAVGKGERYYQQIAINRTVEAILKGQRRVIAHDGDRHRQNTDRLPDLLETLERPLESKLASIAAHVSSTLPTAISSLISRRTASLPPSAMRAGRSKAA